MSEGSRRERPAFVLVHSPLLGPSSWSGVAQELRRLGYACVVPSLRGLPDAASPQWRFALSAVRDATVGLTSPIVLVGHGGAGRLLPAVARSIPGELAGLIFVDGSLPPAAGSATLASDEFLERVKTFMREGFDQHSNLFRRQPPGAPASVDRRVTAVMTERARMPLSYFQDRVRMPRDWTRGRCGYVCLSDELRCQSAVQARALGWPVAAIPGASHLSIVTDPEAVTAVLLDLAGDLTTASTVSRTRLAEKTFDVAGVTL